MILVVSLHIQFNRQAPAPPAGGWVPPLCHYPEPKKLEALIFKRFFDKKAHESRAATGRSEVHKLEHVPKNLCRDADCVGMSNFYLHLGVDTLLILHPSLRSEIIIVAMQNFLRSGVAPATNEQASSGVERWPFQT